MAECPTTNLPSGSPLSFEGSEYNTHQTPWGMNVIPKPYFELNNHGSVISPASRRSVTDLPKRTSILPSQIQYLSMEFTSRETRYDRVVVPSGSVAP